MLKGQSNPFTLIHTAITFVTLLSIFIVHEGFVQCKKVGLYHYPIEVSVPFKYSSSLKNEVDFTLQHVYAANTNTGEQQITNAKSLVEQFPLGNMSLTLSDKPLEIHFKELPSFSYFQNFLSSGVENGTLKIGFKAAHWKRSESFSLTKRCLFWCKTPIHNDQVDLKGSTVTDIILRIDYVNHIKSKKINGFGYSKIKATLIIVTDIMLYAESNSNHKFTTTKIDIHRSNNLLTSGKLNSLPVTLKGIYQDIKSDYYFSLIEKDLKVSNEYLLSGLKNADKVLIYDDERNRRMLILSSFSTTKENTVFTTIKFTQIYYSLQKGILHIKEDFTNIPYSNAKMIGIGYDRINTIYTYIVEDTTKLNSRSVMLAVQLQSGGQSVLFKVTGVEFSNKYIDENFYYFDTERNLFYFKFSKFQGCNEKQLISYNPVTGKIVESFDLPRLSQFTLQPTLESTVGKGISITNFMQRNPTMDSAERVIYLTQFNLTNWDNVKVTPLIEVSENIYLSEIYNFKNSNNYICASFRYSTNDAAQVVKHKLFYHNLIDNLIVIKTIDSPNAHLFKYIG